MFVIETNAPKRATGTRAHRHLSLAMAGARSWVQLLLGGKSHSAR